MRLALLIPLFASVSLAPAACGSSGDSSGPPGTGSPTGAGGSTGGSGGTSAGSAGTSGLGGTVAGSSSQGPLGTGGNGVGGAASGGKSGGSGGPSGAAGQGGASAGASGASGSAGTGGTAVDNPTYPQLFAACFALESSTNKTTAACTGCLSSMCGPFLQPEMECQSAHDTCATCGSGNKSCLCNCVLNLQSACGGAFKSYYWCIHKSCPQACD